MSDFLIGALTGIVAVAVCCALDAFLTRRRKVRKPALPGPMSLQDSASGLLQAGDAAFHSPHRKALTEEFQRLADARLEALPLRLHPAALGLLACQIDWLQRNPERHEVAIAGLRGGILGMAVAGQVYELEQPVSRRGVPS